jgi:hypothetical protein
MKVLAVSVWRLADANSASPTQHSINIPHQHFGIIKIPFLMAFGLVLLVSLYRDLHQ